MKALITGARSLLGKALWESVPKDIDLILTSLPEHKFSHPEFPSFDLDVSKKSQVEKLIRKLKPNCIIHLASLSNVDFCERNPQKADKVNVNGTNNVFKVSVSAGAKVLLSSTNGVFDGKNPPYNESQKPNPIHTYGKTKLAAENIIKHASQNLIVRLITMYGWAPKGARKNPVTWTLDKLKRKETLNMVNDNFVNPLYAPQAADAIWQLIVSQENGVFHIAGRTRVNRYRWTIETAKIFGYPTDNIHPVDSSFFPDIVPRPQDTTFITDKIQNSISWKPLSLKKGLALMKKESPFERNNSRCLSAEATATQNG